MISRVRGELAAVRSDRVEVMTVAGVGYEIIVPARVFETLPEPGGEMDLHTALVSRDDALELFGFGSALDRELFLRLQGASGVGPRLALAILGTLPSRRIVSALRSRSHETLQMVSGVGRKTAERMALELADKLEDLAVSTGSASDDEPLDGTTAALEALRALGYSQLESESALRAARRELDGEVETGELIRAALRHL
ncbi:MAG: Holliday junction branch migration protein RuvA [marine benthic group bacterium]|jgi:Holliday junction DNA helicase RuvA|nr:Holliday junction branch migration protein RuvA [Candidatus Benthicola marisminoris]